MQITIEEEIFYQTTRCSGAGGQHVNKVETAVIACWNIKESSQITEDQKEILLEKLTNRINSEGIIQVKSQIHRSQLANKEEAGKRLIKLIQQALTKKKPRIATKISKQAKEKRREQKERESRKKSDRKKWRPND